eukprot:551691-Prorocentrum_lima.AAC.1
MIEAEVAAHKLVAALAFNVRKAHKLHLGPKVVEALKAMGPSIARLGMAVPKPPASNDEVKLALAR